MKNNKLYITLIASLIAFISTGCLEEFDFKTETFESAIVIEGTITNELKNQAQSLSVLLDSLEYGKNGTVSFQVIKDSIINLKMVTDPTYYSDTSMDYALNAMSIISQIEIFKINLFQLFFYSSRNPDFFIPKIRSNFRLVAISDGSNFRW